MKMFKCADGQMKRGKLINVVCVSLRYCLTVLFNEKEEMIVAVNAIYGIA